MTRMQHDDPAKTPATPARPGQPRHPDTVPRTTPPARKSTDPEPVRPSFDRGDGQQPKIVRRDG